MRETQKVVWDLVPTADPDAIFVPDPTKPEGRRYQYYIVNASTGSGMDILEKIVEEFIPVVDDPRDSTTTLKEIIRTDRDECPCCHYDLEVIVRVRPQGVMCPGWDQVGGLYRVTIRPERHDAKITVEKLSGTVIHESRTPFLPRKDYP